MAQIMIGKGKPEVSFFIEAEAFPGVKRVAGHAAKDLELVTGSCCHISEHLTKEEGTVIAAGTLGRSRLIDELESAGAIDLSGIRNKWECYLFQVLSIDDELRKKVSLFEDLPQMRELLIIAGSDKRGTIYGLFHLSELAGVSPWIYFADVMPAHRDIITVSDQDNRVSKEPSVRYRGIFINDEWPSFGNWTMKHFGGFAADMYQHVFELILRLKGNYLWPAMWTSSFSLDGPGMASAELADEYGIVMSNSHHEPCLRHSEEWDLVRGDNSPYGNAWNFDKNREGLTNYWRDGLRRNGALENVITMGMRGERDSEILGRESTLADNINYLKDVIRTQNRLIREEIDPDLTKVPRMLALYKEVEMYYNGDETTPGLSEWEELDGITFMLCEDNFGNMRMLPEPDKKERRGGYGMYYHFDYHGAPVSYEWVNSTHLLKVLDQMGMAYETGVREIWVVNTGDLKPQELPISYFMDLAYDFDTWGRQGAGAVEAYTKKWVTEQFGAAFDEREQKMLFDVIDGYTKRNSIRKPETIGPKTYHPAFGREGDLVWEECSRLEQMTEELHAKAKQLTALGAEGNTQYASFYELVFYPVMASMNLIKMQIAAGKNELYASQGRMSANRWADIVKTCMDRDRELNEGWDKMAEGKWEGMMGSEHIGFTAWNDEECRLPLRTYVEPARKPRLIAAFADDVRYTMGGDWTRKTLVSNHFMNPTEREAVLQLANGADTPFHYEIHWDAEWLNAEKKSGTVVETEEILLTADRKKLHEAVIRMQGKDGEGQRTMTAHLQITTGFAKVNVDVRAMDFTEEECTLPYVSERGVIIEASEYAEKKDGSQCCYVSVPRLGIFPQAEKVMPVTAQPDADNAPELKYECLLPEDGSYEITILSTPSNPIRKDHQLCFGFQWEEEPAEIINSVGADYRGGDFMCGEWARGVLEQIHRTKIVKNGKTGKCSFRVFAVDAGFIPERIEIRKL